LNRESHRQQVRQAALNREDGLRPAEAKDEKTLNAISEPKDVFASAGAKTLSI
jgi:hypothetical protein